MPSTRWRKVLADLTANRGRSLLVVLSIAVGVLAVGIIMSANCVLSRELATGYAQSAPPHATLYCSPCDGDMIHAIESMPEIAAAAGRVCYNARAILGADRYQDVQLIALDDPVNPGVKRVEPQEGDWPPSKHAIVVERLSLGALETKIGETLTVESPTGLVREMPVAGTVRDASMVAPQFQWNTVAYVEPRSMAWLGLPEGYNQVAIILQDPNPSRQQVTDVATEVQNKLEKSGVSVHGFWVPKPGQHPIQDIVQPVFTILGILGVFALGLAGFLVLNTVSAVLCQETINIGMMKAIGARRGQIVGIYLALVACYGLLGMALGMPLAAAGSKLFVDYMGHLLNVDVASYWASGYVYAVQIIAGLLTPVVAALVPVLKATSIGVRQAVQSHGISGASSTGRLGGAMLRVRWMPRPLVMSLRNTFRRKGRLALTLLTFTMAGGILIAVLSVRASMMATLDDAFDYFGYDIGVSLGSYQRVSEIDAMLDGMPGITAIESWTSGRAERVLPEGGLSEGFTLFAPPTDTTMIRPTLTEGRWLLPEDENALVVNSFCTHNDPGITLGSTITLQHDKHGRPVEQDWVVVGIVKGVMSGPIAYATDDYMSSLIGHPGQSYYVRMRLEDGSAANQHVMAQAVEELFEGQGIPVTSLEIIADQQEMIAGQLGLIVGTLLFMAVLFSMVGGLGVMGTMGINVLERTHEIGVMRAVGASDRAVLGIVVCEGAVIGLVSWLAGTCVSLPLAQGLTSVVGQAVLHSPVTHVYSVAAVGLWLLVAVLLAGIASLIPARRAVSLTVRDVLAYQ